MASGMQPSGSPDIGSALSWAMSKFQAGLAPLLVITLASLVVGFLANVVLTSIVNGIFFDDIYDQPGTFMTWGLYGFITGVTTILTALIWLPLRSMALGATKGQPISFDLATKIPNVGPAAMTTLLVGVGTAIGYMFCWLPGLVFGILTWHAIFVAMDEGGSPVDAIKKSIQMTTKGPMLIGTIVSGIIAAVGVIACGVGLLATVPIGMLASAHLYQTAKSGMVAA